MKNIFLRAALITVLLLALTFLFDSFRNYQLAVIAATFCTVAGLSLLIGLTGQLSLGHAVLMASGGYGYALSAGPAADAGVDGSALVLIGILGAIMLSGAVGTLLGLASARLRGPYLAGLTLALVIALPAFASQLRILGGEQGLSAPYVAVPELLQSFIAPEQWHAWIAVLIAALTVTPLAVMRAGRAGLRMRAVHGDETAARLSGVVPGRVKVGAFIASSLAAGMGGAALCIITQSVTPGGYDLAFSLLLLVAAVVGGLGSISGAAVGSALIVLLPWLIDTAISAADISSALQHRLSGNLTLLIFGILVIVVTIMWPGGLAGAVQSRFVRRRRRRTRTADKPEHATTS
ncbi:branched-chain amino acid ABC transporter permease [Nesterenkonia salmonea]|uniref:Branched-chain amino acid ABC transporter permease n=1 Tax=Nesterenkonia salmonea TaxID=1804987 RepID=A0A5R9BMA7_9MICC|nr:branched-chain amino acid ABC transporter permease [Nesterenkonia salmonea]TLQ01081.1 branched-chain amino acid ABC transporter permease [Nesterenkonia salmonea]